MPKIGTGYRPEPYSAEDFHWQHSRHEEARRKTKLQENLYEKGVGECSFPAEVDLKKDCSPVRFQGGFNTCTAFASASMLEFFERRAHGLAPDLSRLFLYKVTKNLLQETGNVPVYIRQAIGALKLIGAPEERLWPYPKVGTLKNMNTKSPLLDKEPSAFVYAAAEAHRALQPVRLDRDHDNRPENDKNRQMEVLKAHLSTGMTFVFGFPLFGSVQEQNFKNGGLIPFPTPQDSQVGAHAVMAVGYDDTKKIQNTDDKGIETTGAFQIQNSWGTEWGDQGYGWLPYRYVLDGSAKDFWTITKASWFDSLNFQIL